jgi:hypothetical protein
MAIVKRFWRGWAVDALFGQTTAGEKVFFSILIGAAVAWPILLGAILKPRLAVQLVAIFPPPASIPSETVRLAWIGLALFIPLGVGIAVAFRAPGGPRGRLAQIWRGFPITAGLAAAFGIIFVSVPVMHLCALFRRQKSAEIPLTMNASAYHEVAARICAVLNRHGFSFQSAAPDWWISAPVRLLTWLGGESLRSHVPRRTEHFVAGDLSMSLYPSGLILRGRARQLTWAHGLIAETVVRTDGLQTTAPEAQVLERRLRPLWKSFDLDPTGRAGHAGLSLELDRIARELRTLQASWDDWQVLYRQILQLGRALAGQPQVLDRGSSPSLSFVANRNDSGDIA